MHAPTDPGSDDVRARVAALRNALRQSKREAVTATVLDLRRKLAHCDYAPLGHGASQLAVLSVGLRQIDRAARAGDFAEAAKVFAHLEAVL